MPATTILLILFPFLSSGDTTEVQTYQVLRTDGPFEIRYYPPAVLATVDVAGSRYEEVSSRGFRRLANYIFGGNTRQQKIAMTAPVHMEMGVEKSTMSFVMPAAYALADLPQPAAADLRLHQSARETVAVLRFSGWARQHRLDDHVQKLITWMEEQDLEPLGPWRYLGYDPPWRMTNRRNEVVIPIKGKDDTTLDGHSPK